MITLSIALLAARLKAPTADVHVLCQALGLLQDGDGDEVSVVDLRGRLADLPAAHRQA